MTVSLRLLLPAIAVVLVLSMWLVLAGVTATAVRASSVRSVAGPQMIGVQSQEEGEQGAPDTTAEPDARVEVQVWTVAAAGMAMAVGLVALLVRMLMGWVKPAPPPPEEAHH